jgi:peptide-methionine (S)-S-oxide reductase
MKKVILAGGCFWGVEKYFQLKIKEVINTDVVYAQSKIPNPTYEQVCTGNTGAVEAVYIEYKDEVKLSVLIDLLFEVIDPLSLNKQGNDVGSQYRTGVYVFTKEDLLEARIHIEKLQKKFSKKIMVEVQSVQNYFLAEEYHQDYLKKNPNGYCHISFD